MSNLSGDGTTVSTRVPAVSMTNSSTLHTALQQQLYKRRQRGALRSLRAPKYDQKLHEFSSNDYLDLAGSPILRALFYRYLESETELASTGSRLLSGNTNLANEIEEAARQYWQCPDVLLCGSGYEANVSIFNVLPQPGDTIIFDELIHASVHVGMKGSRATSRIRWRHNDKDHLREILQRENQRHENQAHNVFLAVETVYSMDGDLAPLQEIIASIRSHCPYARLILDEAHATGVFGASGRGLAWSLNLQHAPEVLLRLHTFGKGAGGTGAVILCDSIIKQYLLNYAKSLIYSTFMSVPALALCRASIELLRCGHGEGAQKLLWSCIEYTQGKTTKLSSGKVLRLADTIDSPIIPVMSPHAVELSCYLEDHGFRIMPVRYPTVPKGQERIRICLRANMSHELIDSLFDLLGQWKGLQNEDMAANKTKGTTDRSLVMPKL